MEVGEESFTAYHEETDDCLTIRYYKSSNDAYIDIDKAIVLDEEWPSKNAIAKQIPTPEVTTCYVKTISDTRIEVYVGDLKEGKDGAVEPLPRRYGAEGLLPIHDK